MRIGLDFDNTIACYEGAFAHVGCDLGLLPPGFSGSKAQVKHHLMNEQNDEKSWMTIQGQVYGAFMGYARLFDGVLDFLRRCKREGVEVFIVSHKTQYGHFDPQKVDLRDAARGWLSDQNICGEGGFVAQERVFFLTTRDEKVDKIRDLGCTHFVDDLMEVLTHPHFPDTAARFFFDPDAHHSGAVPSGVVPCATWRDIEEKMFAA